MTISTSEQETTINFTRKENECVIWTCDTTVMTKLDKKYQREKEHLKDGEVWAVEYKINKTLLSFRNSGIKRKPLTAEQREALARRLKKVV